MTNPKSGQADSPQHSQDRSGKRLQVDPNPMSHTQERLAAHHEMQKLITEGLESGVEEGFSIDALQEALDKV